MERLTVRLPEDLHRRLREQSRRTGCSVNQTIVNALSREMEQAPARELSEVERLREALGDLIVRIDYSYLPPHLRPGPDLPDTDEYRRSMPPIDPPLSQAIVEERNEYRW